MRTLSSLVLGSVAAAALLVPVASQAGIVRANVSPPQRHGAMLQQRTSPQQQNLAAFRYSGFNDTTTPKHFMWTRSHQPIVPNQCCLLNYHGGPVLTTPKAYLIFWGFQNGGDPDHIAKLVTNLYKAFGGSGFANIVTQYYGPGSVHITNPMLQFGGAWHDGTNAIPSSPTDSQIQAEAQRGVAHFGYNANGAYIVLTAHNHNSSGFGVQYCAYHGASSSPSGPFSYTNMPYAPDANDCGSNVIAPPGDETAVDEGVTIIVNHEYTESVTDPMLTAWWSDSNGEEIGDLCAWQNIQNDRFRRHKYTMQPMYSNATQTCVHTYP